MSARLSDYIYNKLSSELMDRFLTAYLESFKNKNAKFKMPLAGQKMRADYEIALNFFSSQKSSKRAKSSFEVIDKILAVIESDAEFAFVDFFTLYKAYPDIPLDYVEALLSKRDDLDRSKVKEIMENCRRKVSEETNVTNTTTLFSKISKETEKESFW